MSSRARDNAGKNDGTRRNDASSWTQDERLDSSIRDRSAILIHANTNRAAERGGGGEARIISLAVCVISPAASCCGRARDAEPDEAEIS